MRHHYLQHQTSINLNKLYSTVHYLNLCEKFSFINYSNNCKNNVFQKYDVINHDDINFFALLCAVCEKLNVMLSITPAQTWGRFCEYLLT